MITAGLLFVAICFYVGSQIIKHRYEFFEKQLGEAFQFIQKKEEDQIKDERALKDKMAEISRVFKVNEAVFIGIKIDLYDLIKAHEDIEESIEMIKSGELDDEELDFILEDSKIKKQDHESYFRNTFNMSTEEYEVSRIFQFGMSLN